MSRERVKCHFFDIFQARATLEEKNNTLQDTISRLKEDVRNADNRRNNLEQDLRRLNQEYNEMVRKLSVAEATLEVALKVSDNGFGFIFSCWYGKSGCT